MFNAKKWMRLLSVCFLLSLLVTGAVSVRAATVHVGPGTQNSSSVRITKQPANVTVRKGATAKVTCTAKGTGLKYQWFYTDNAADTTFSKASVTTASYSVTMNANRNGRKVYCIVTDKNGASVRSKTVTMSMASGVKITAQPSNKFVPAKATAKFTVKANGTGLKYQWQYRTTSKGSWKTATATGSKTATLSVSATANRNKYQYRCKITDKYRNVVYSKAVTLKLVTLKITSQPVNRYMLAGKTAVFSVKASGNGLKYQWQYRTSSTGSWKTATATGNKTASMSIAAAASRNGYQYRCKITDKHSNVIYSKIVTLKLVTLKITAQPANRFAAKGQTVKFTVKASGTGLKYQWQYRTSSKGSWNTATATGYNTATLSVAATASVNNYQYRCKITDQYANSLYSSIATLTVNVQDLECISLSYSPNPDNVRAISVYDNGDGTCSVDYMGQIRKVGSMDASAMEPINQALHNSGLLALNGQTKYQEGEAFGSMYVVYADGTAYSADFSGVIPEAFVTGYDAMDTDFQRITANIPEYIPEPMLVGEVAKNDRAALDAILAGITLDHPDAFMISGVAKNAYFASTMGLSSDEGIVSGVSFCPMMMTYAYSLNIVTVEKGTSVDAVAQDFNDNIDWFKWICVFPSNALIATKGNQVLCLMGSDDLYNQTASAIAAAGWTTVQSLTNPNM